MNKRSKKLIGFTFAFIILSCCAFLGFSIISYPSTKSIANDYLQAIINEDFEAAFRLGRSKEYCQDELRDSIAMDIDEFGGSEVRDVKIEVQGNTGSDDERQFADIAFSYRHPDQEEWQAAEIRLTTDHDVPGLRYVLCGNVFRER